MVRVISYMFSTEVKIYALAVLVHTLQHYRTTPFLGKYMNIAL